MPIVNKIEGIILPWWPDNGDYVEQFKEPDDVEEAYNKLYNFCVEYRYTLLPEEEMFCSIITDCKELDCSEHRQFRINFGSHIKLLSDNS